jgi:hypothetical protein
MSVTVKESDKAALMTLVLGLLQCGPTGRPSAAWRREWERTGAAVRRNKYECPLQYAASMAGAGTLAYPDAFCYLTGSELTETYDAELMNWFVNVVDYPEYQLGPADRKWRRTLLNALKLKEA